MKFTTPLLPATLAALLLPTGIAAQARTPGVVSTYIHPLPEPGESGEPLKPREIAIHKLPDPPLLRNDLTTLHTSTRRHACTCTSGTSYRTQNHTCTHTHTPYHTDIPHHTAHHNSHQNHHHTAHTHSGSDTTQPTFRTHTRTTLHTHTRKPGETTIPNRNSPQQIYHWHSNSIITIPSTDHIVRVVCGAALAGLFMGVGITGLLVS
ncbi:Protein of unknown function [Pyronema omphalodes CBS 100304]|uniref:Uncharacterized protein n=1 Tax=Pyronema omphalodes (strain CBS 100304) TaxID=1076935 RepID=U4LPV2_PYROM|nr:Protein of unknown function [Pyronema omphalodes CBS 100304]